MTDDDGVTPLHEGTFVLSVEHSWCHNIHGCASLASWGGNLSSVRLLLAAGADPNTRDQEGNTCLHKAAFVGNYDVILLLVRAKAEIDAADGAGGAVPTFHFHSFLATATQSKFLCLSLFLLSGTPLHNAIYRGHYNCVCLLLELGAGALLFLHVDSRIL